jgi:hypothetical protein
VPKGLPPFRLAAAPWLASGLHAVPLSCCCPRTFRSSMRSPSASAMPQGFAEPGARGPARGPRNTLQSECGSPWWSIINDQRWAANVDHDGRCVPPSARVIRGRAVRRMGVRRALPRPPARVRKAANAGSNRGRAQRTHGGAKGETSGASPRDPARRRGGARVATRRNPNRHARCEAPHRREVADSTSVAGRSARRTPSAYRHVRGDTRRSDGLQDEVCGGNGSEAAPSAR